MSYGRTAYEAWDQWQSGRVGTRVPDSVNPSGCASRIEGLAYPLHAARLSFLPESVRGIAPAIVTPSDGRRILQPRALSALPSALSRVGLTAGGDRPYGTRIDLRRQAAKHATEDRAESFKSVSISPFRHVPKHGEDGVPNPRIHFTFKEKNDARRR